MWMDSKLMVIIELWILPKNESNSESKACPFNEKTRRRKKMKHLGRFSSATGCLLPSLFPCLHSFSFSASSVVLGDCWKLLESSIAKRKEINLKHFSTHIKAHRVEIGVHLRVHALVPVLSSFLLLLFSAYWMEKKEINWRNNEMKENTIDCYWMGKTDGGSLCGDFWYLPLHC